MLRSASRMVRSIGGAGCEYQRQQARAVLQGPACRGDGLRGLLGRACVACAATGDDVTAEGIVERIVAALNADPDVREARTVSTIYQDRLAIAVVDRDDRIWVAHVLKDHADRGSEAQ